MMVDRRKFLRLGALASAAGVCIPSPVGASGFAGAGQQYGVQLYSVRKSLASDLAAVLKQIREIGYTQVELIWSVYSRPAKELCAMVADAGLTAPSGLFHFADLEQRIDYARELGLTYMVSVDVPHKDMKTLDDMKACGEECNRAGEKIRSAGMQFAYHNGTPEFAPVQGSSVFAELMKNTDPKLVGLEIDCLWAVQGGQDVSAMLDRYRDRVHLLHLKDQTLDTAAAKGRITEVGKGTIDWPAVLHRARAQGVKYFFIDQDSSALATMESLKDSYVYLSKLVG